MDYLDWLLCAGWGKQVAGKNKLYRFPIVRGQRQGKRLREWKELLWVECSCPVSDCGACSVGLSERTAKRNCAPAFLKWPKELLLCAVLRWLKWTKRSSEEVAQRSEVKRNEAERMTNGWAQWVKWPQAHGNKTNHSLFFPAPLKGWRGVVELRVGSGGRSTASNIKQMRWLRAVACFMVAAVLAI